LKRNKTNKMSIIPFKNQSYLDLKNQHDSDNLFEDPEFPANDRAIYYTSQFANQLSRYFPRGVEWKRPTVIIYKLSRKFIFIAYFINLN